MFRLPPETRFLVATKVEPRTRSMGSRLVAEPDRARLNFRTWLRADSESR